jgi:hypothetical protein
MSQKSFTTSVLGKVGTNDMVVQNSSEVEKALEASNNELKLRPLIFDMFPYSWTSLFIELFP